MQVSDIMMKFFLNNSVGPNEESTSSLLLQYAMALDHKLTEKRLRIINGPGLNLIEFELEMRAHDAQIKSSLQEIKTLNSTVLTKTPFRDVDLIRYPIILTTATAEEIDAHYKNIAEVTLQRGTTNCVGLASVTLLLAEDLSKNELYNKIQVQICQLSNWGHVFIRFKHLDESKGLFYDPWYQRCQTNTPEVPVLFNEDDFDKKMGDMVTYVYNQPEKTISHTRYFRNFNVETSELSPGEIINYNYDYRYSIIYSSMTSHFGSNNENIPCIIS